MSIGWAVMTTLSRLAQVAEWTAMRKIKVNLTLIIGVDQGPFVTIISRCAPVVAQSLDHVRSSLVCRPVGVLHSWRGVLGSSLCDMSAPTCGSKRSDAARKARAHAAPIAKKKRRLNAPDHRGGEGWRGRDPISTASSTKTITETTKTGATRQRGA